MGGGSGYIASSVSMALPCVPEVFVQIPECCPVQLPGPSWGLWGVFQEGQGPLCDVSNAMISPASDDIM